jgi:hypothetical protein
MRLVTPSSCYKIGKSDEGSPDQSSTGVKNMVCLIQAQNSSWFLEAHCLNRKLAVSTGQAWSRHVVSCPRLVRERLGDADFDRQFKLRRRWCRENCFDDFTIDALPSSVEFSFVDDSDARRFRLAFC